MHCINNGHSWLPQEAVRPHCACQLMCPLILMIYDKLGQPKMLSLLLPSYLSRVDLSNNGDASTV